MNRPLMIHHTINIVLLIILVILNFANLGIISTIILALLFLINTILLIRANKKFIDSKGVTIENKHHNF
jgi:uncharacterized protein (DUF58 family)